MTTFFEHPDVVDIPGIFAGWWRGLRSATAFLTRLPVTPAETPAPPGFTEAMPPAASSVAPGDIGAATALFPLVGAGIGLASALVLLGTFELGLHPFACALAALATAAILSGALHEDGLADFADGLGAGGSSEQRLAVMRDSRIGTFGTLAVVFAVGLRVSILGGLPSPEVAVAALLASAAASRAVLPVMMRWQPRARSDGLSVAAGLPTLSHVAIALALALVVCLLSLGFRPTLAVIVGVALAGLGVAALAQRTLGGQTGDVLGAAQVLGEVAALAAIAAVE